MKRTVQRNTPRGRAHCEKCGAALDYYCGSIVWQCTDRDLCGSCAGAEAAKAALDVFRRKLSEAT
jgi:hypothetical protein